MILKQLLKLGRKKKKTPSLQEYYFANALDEMGVDKENIKINHYNGECFHDELGRFPLIFPMSLVKIVEELSKEKKQDYFFQGMIQDNRSWLKNYENVSNSFYGRNKKTKYSFDIQYYEALSKTRFGLAPIGECPWSYRFFEAIMCFAIPVIGKNDQDVYAEKFHYFRDGEEHIYDFKKAKQNYASFLKDHTLLEKLHKIAP